MVRKDQAPLFPTPADVKAAAKKARTAKRVRASIPALYNNANKAVNAYRKSHDNWNLARYAENALSKLLDALVFDVKPNGGFTDELPVDFVGLVMTMLRALDYRQSLEAYLMYNVASNRVNPGYVFRAQWPDYSPDFDKTPRVLVTYTPPN